MTTLTRNDNQTQAPRLGYVVQINNLMSLLGVSTRYQMARILGMANVSQFYRYLTSEDYGVTPASKYLWRMLHLACLVASGDWDIETFDPDTYWPRLDHALITRLEKANAEPL